MKILFPATHYYPVIGGIENWTQNIAERLSEKAEIFVVTGKVKYQLTKQELNGVKIWRTSPLALSNLSASPLIYTLSILPSIFLKSLSLIKKEKIDLMHCQGFLSSFLGFLLSKLTGVPYIATVQRLEEKRNPFKNFIYRNASLCIGASQVIRKYFEEIGCKKIEVIPNGIDLKRFKNLKRCQKEGFVILTVARLEKVKGVKYLIEAVRILNAKYKMQNTRFLIIGDGSERNNLENLSGKLGLEEKVKFVGQIPPEGIPEYLARADCFVLPSLREGFGIAILESMAAGVPVIATGVGGILDIIEDGKTGILVEPGNPEAIARALLRIYSDQELSGNLVRNAQNNLKKYDWKNITEKVYQIYQQIISLKIVLATGIFPPDIGGPATYTEKLAVELSEKGYKVEVITYRDRGDFNFKRNYNFKITKILRDYPKGLRHFLYFWKLFWLAKDADVIYAQNVTSAGFPALLVSKLLRKKFVLKVVGDAAWEQKRRYLGPIQKYVAKNAHKIIVPSEYVRKMVGKWGVKNHKAEVIYNAPEANFQQDILKEDAKRKIGIKGDILLSVGRLAAWKGFDDLIAIMPDLLKINPNFRLVIAGEGGQRLPEQEGVRIIGKVPHEQMSFYFKAADLFVLNSGYEGLSHVILEAMQFGVPVIASDEGGNPELIQDNFNGFLVEYKNREQLKSAILKLWQDKDLQKKFVRNSHEKLKNFNWENLVNQTLEVLKG